MSNFESEKSSLQEDGCTSMERNQNTSATEKLIKLPLSRVKIIVKTVPSVSLVTSEALVSIGFLCEQFIQEFCQSVVEVTAQEGKKTVTKQHVQSAVQSIQKYEFLDGIIE
uniref:Histone-like transcription factor ccaat-related n=2 Tax=Schistosoma mansoni TaxID=6183 RepID=A0A3Q0KFF7_SCHMA